jgi:HEAT repeat protein
MISFPCPHCDCELEVPDKAAGKKVACPECEERSVVPMRSITPKRSERSSRRREREPAPKNNTPLILGGVGAGVLVLVAVVVAFVMLRPAPSPGTGQAHVTPPIVPPAPPSNPGPGKDQNQNASRQPSKDEDGNDDGPISAGREPTGQEIHKHVLKSVAWIITIDQQAGQMSLGSGSLIDREHKLVLTNHHVISHGTDLIVFFPKYRNGELVVSKEDYLKQSQRDDFKDVIRGRVVAQDQVCDLALVQLDRVPDGIEALALANKGADVGESVNSVGVAGASGAMWGFTQGSVRSKPFDKSWRDPIGVHRANMIEATNPTNPGDSGGPLVNSRGELVGVTQGGLPGANAMNQFINVSEAVKIIETYCRSQGYKWNRETRSLKLGSNPDDVLRLVKRLDRSNSNNRADLARTLGIIGPEAKMAIPTLLKLLKDEANDVTAGVLADSLAKIGPPAAQDLIILRDAANDLNPKVRAYAASSIGAIGPAAGSALTVLVAAAKDKNVEVRQNAIRSMGKMGGNGKETILPVLTNALKDPEHEVRVAAGTSLESMDTFSAGETPLLISMLKLPDSEVRASGARALAKMGPKAKAALPDLMEAFKGTDNAVRRAAIGALVGLGAEAKSAVPAFTEALGDSDVEIRKQATVALAKIGPDAKPAADALANLVSDSDKDVRKSAIKALASIGAGSRPVVDALSQSLKGDDKDLRIDVANALGAIGPPAYDATTSLLACFEDLGPDEKVQRNQFGAALGKIVRGKDIKPLVNALYSVDPSVRSGACIALGEVGPPARKAAPYLATLAQNDLIIQVRDAALSAHSRVTAKPAPKEKK